eukprot:jgi/Chrzof1/8499/Cz03g13110.t1
MVCKLALRRVLWILWLVVFSSGQHQRSCLAFTPSHQGCSDHEAMSSHCSLVHEETKSSNSAHRHTVAESFSDKKPFQVEDLDLDPKLLQGTVMHNLVSTGNFLGFRSVLQVLSDNHNFPYLLNALQAKDDRGFTITNLLACTGQVQEFAHLLELIFRMHGEGVDIIRRVVLESKSHECTAGYHSSGLYSHGTLRFPNSNQDMFLFGGITPIECAAAHGHTQIAQMLVQSGVSPGRFFEVAQVFGFSHEMTQAVQIANKEGFWAQPKIFLPGQPAHSQKQPRLRRSANHVEIIYKPNNEVQQHQQPQQQEITYCQQQPVQDGCGCGPGQVPQQHMTLASGSAVAQQAGMQNSTSSGMFGRSHGVQEALDVLALVLLTGMLLLPLWSALCLIWRRTYRKRLASQEPVRRIKQALASSFSQDTAVVTAAAAAGGSRGKGNSHNDVEPIATVTGSRKKGYAFKKRGQVLPARHVTKPANDAEVTPAEPNTSLPPAVPTSHVRSNLFAGTFTAVLCTVSWLLKTLCQRLAGMDTTIWPHGAAAGCSHAAAVRADDARGAGGSYRDSPAGVAADAVDLQRSYSSSSSRSTQVRTPSRLEMKVETQSPSLGRHQHANGDNAQTQNVLTPSAAADMNCANPVAQSNTATGELDDCQSKSCSDHHDAISPAASRLRKPAVTAVNVPEPNHDSHMTNEDVTTVNSSVQSPTSSKGVKPKKGAAGKRGSGAPKHQVTAYADDTSKLISTAGVQQQASKADDHQLQNGKYSDLTCLGSPPPGSSIQNAIKAVKTCPSLYGGYQPANGKNHRSVAKTAIAGSSAAAKTSLSSYSSSSNVARKTSNGFGILSGVSASPMQGSANGTKGQNDAASAHGCASAPSTPKTPLAVQPPPSTGTTWAALVMKDVCKPQKVVAADSGSSKGASGGNTATSELAVALGAVALGQNERLQHLSQCMPVPQQQDQLQHINPSDCRCQEHTQRQADQLCDSPAKLDHGRCTPCGLPAAAAAGEDDGAEGDVLSSTCGITRSLDVGGSCCLTDVDRTRDQHAGHEVSRCTAYAVSGGGMQGLQDSQSSEGQNQSTEVDVNKAKQLHLQEDATGHNNQPHSMIDVQQQQQPQQQQGAERPIAGSDDTSEQAQLIGDYADSVAEAVAAFVRHEGINGSAPPTPVAAATPVPVPTSAAHCDSAAATAAAGSGTPDEPHDMDTLFSLLGVAPPTSPAAAGFDMLQSAADAGLQLISGSPQAHGMSPFHHGAQQEPVLHHTSTYLQCNPLTPGGVPAAGFGRQMSVSSHQLQQQQQQLPLAPAVMPSTMALSSSPSAVATGSPHLYPQGIARPPPSSWPGSAQQHVLTHQVQDMTSTLPFGGTLVTLPGPAPGAAQRRVLYAAIPVPRHQQQQQQQLLQAAQQHQHVVLPQQSQLQYILQQRHLGQQQQQPPQQPPHQQQVLLQPQLCQQSLQQPILLQGLNPIGLAGPQNGRVVSILNASTPPVSMVQVLGHQLPPLSNNNCINHPHTSPQLAGSNAGASATATSIPMLLPGSAEMLHASRQVLQASQQYAGRTLTGSTGISSTVPMRAVSQQLPRRLSIAIPPQQSHPSSILGSPSLGGHMVVAGSPDVGRVAVAGSPGTARQHSAADVILMQQSVPLAAKRPSLSMSWSDGLAAASSTNTPRSASTDWSKLSDELGEQQAVASPGSTGATAHVSLHANHDVSKYHAQVQVQQQQQPGSPYLTSIAAQVPQHGAMQGDTVMSSPSCGAGGADDGTTVAGSPGSSSLHQQHPVSLAAMYAALGLVEAPVAVASAAMPAKAKVTSISMLTSPIQAAAPRDGLIGSSVVDTEPGTTPASYASHHGVAGEPYGGQAGLAVSPATTATAGKGDGSSSVHGVSESDVMAAELDELLHMVSGCTSLVE